MTLLENVYTTAHIFDDIVIARDTTYFIIGGRHTRLVRELLSSLAENSPLHPLERSCNRYDGHEQVNIAPS